MRIYWFFDFFQKVAFPKTFFCIFFLNFFVFYWDLFLEQARSRTQKNSWRKLPQKKLQRRRKTEKSKAAAANGGNDDDESNPFRFYNRSVDEATVGEKKSIVNRTNLSSNRNICFSDRRHVYRHSRFSRRGMLEYFWNFIFYFDRNFIDVFLLKRIIKRFWIIFKLKNFLVLLECYILN